jgi:hypothetical protein
MRSMRRFRELVRADRTMVGYFIPSIVVRNPSGHVSARTSSAAGRERLSVGLDLPRRRRTTSTTLLFAAPRTGPSAER